MKWKQAKHERFRADSIYQWSINRHDLQVSKIDWNGEMGVKVGLTFWRNDSANREYQKTQLQMFIK